MDRRVEITGPTNAKMVINALNSGAKVFMADFEDATAPVWDELVQGQVNLRNRWLGQLDFTDPGQRQALCDRRQSGRADGPPARLAPAGAARHGRRRADRRRLFDFGLYLLHNAQAALDAGSGPYFYLPKLESRHEAALWSDVFAYSRGAARPRARDDQGDGADRDAPGRVRDGRDPPRAARQYRRPQLRPLGLYLLATSSGSAARPTG